MAIGFADSRRTETISTVAGTGVSGLQRRRRARCCGRIWFPFGVAVAPDGTLYFADRSNDVIGASIPRDHRHGGRRPHPAGAGGSGHAPAPQPLHAPSAHPPTESH
jgi:hypothetical protein